jgi:3-oxoacyl-[acyl-carrier-protein] synthase-1
MNAVAILKAGMVSPVGFDAAASCAAIRVGIDAFAETQFKFDGEWLIGAQVPFSDGWRGREKLLRMVTPAIAECLVGADARPQDTVLLLCLAEAERSGRLAGLDETLLRDVETRLGVKFDGASAIFSEGRVGGVKAVERAGKILYQGSARFVIVAGVDSLLVGPTLTTIHEADRLKTGANSNGLIPGEAGAAVLLGRPSESPDHLLACVGVGFGVEKATINSEEPLRADGLREAVSSAIKDAAIKWEQVDFRITGVNGEQYWFKESSLALVRTMRVLKARFELWHPAECIGEIGAAIVPCVLGVALAAIGKRYAPGSGILCHFSDDGEARGALILQSPSAANSAPGR